MTDKSSFARVGRLEGVAPGAGLLVAISASVTTAVALGFLSGGLSAPVALGALATGFLFGLLAFLRSGGKAAPVPTPWDVVLLVVFALASLRAFLWLLYPVGDEWRILSPYNLGDISLHIQFIRYFASGVEFWPASPILSGVPLSYPPGVDLWNSLLLLTGVPVARGLVWTGLAGAALTAWALWRWGGAFAIAAFLFNGGLAGFAVLQSGQFGDLQADLAWKNLFLTMLVPQRGLLYALPCGLMLLRAWRDDFFGNGSGLPRAAQFFLYVTMPLFNVHAFLFLSLTLGAIFLFEGRARRRLLLFVGAALIPATLAVWLVTGGFSAASGLRWLPGWMQGDEGWRFWAGNFGLTLPLLAALFWRGFLRGDAESRAFSGAAIGVFVLCLLVAFAPWEWDNTKLLLWAWVAAAPFLWDRVLAPLPGFARTALCIGLFFSGAMALIGGLDGRHGYQLANRTELAATELALRNVPQSARIAVEPEFNHPVILLGRPVVCGYEGHLWSHGLPYRATLAELRRALQRQPGWMDSARNVGAKWIFLRGDKPEVIQIPPATEYF